MCKLQIKHPLGFSETRLRLLQSIGMLSHIKFSQHNTARGREILQSLFDVSIKGETDILLVQEPYLFHNQISQTYQPIIHSAYQAIPPITNQFLRPRVMTYVKKASQLQVMPRYDLVSDPNYQILEVDLPGEAFYIIHIYNEKPLTPSFSQHTVQRFLNSQLQLDKPFLLLGDFNLHHSSWNALIQTFNPLAISFANYLE